MNTYKSCLCTSKTVITTVFRFLVKKLGENWAVALQQELPDMWILRSTLPSTGQRRHSTKKAKCIILLLFLIALLQCACCLSSQLHGSYQDQPGRHMEWGGGVNEKRKICEWNQSLQTWSQLFVLAGATVTDVTAAVVFYIEVSTARQRKTSKRWIILDILKGHITVPWT